jgi:hypothetical protein
MDYSKLGWQEFEMLCARLLQASGNTLQGITAKGQDISADFVFSDPGGKTWVAEVKHSQKSRTGTTLLRQASLQLSAARQFTGAEHGLLIVSMLLPQALKHELAQRENISVWDGSYLNELLELHPDIRRDFQILLDAQAATRRGVGQDVPLEPRAQELITRLESLPPGRDHWRDFEELCVEILTYALFPQLGVPVVQSRSEDGLDIRDAVFPISAPDSFWDEIKQTCSSRFVVAEFKNYTESISQREVESIQQYLYIKARRMFGVLCTRKQPAESAMLARRRAWVESDKLIVICSDDELKDLIRARSYGERPTDVFDAQLQEFFLRLAP